MNARETLFHIQLGEVVAPKRVLCDQAHFLSQLSDGTILGRVESKRGNKGHADYFTHAFKLSVPALDYTSTLFEVTHPIDVYPVQVRADDWSMDQECPNAEAFVATVRDILNAPMTKTRLEALRSQALAEVSGEPPIDIDANPRTDPVEPEMLPNPDATTESKEELQAVAPAPALETPPTVEEPVNEVKPEFIEWGEPVELNEDNIAGCPAAQGAAVLYADGNVVFVIYSRTNLKKSLLKQLGSNASPEVSRRRKKGIQLVGGAVDSEYQAESRVTTFVHKKLLGAMRQEKGSSDWA